MFPTCLAPCVPRSPGLVPPCLRRWRRVAHRVRPYTSAAVAFAQSYDPAAAKQLFFDIYINTFATPDSGIAFPGAVDLVRACRAAGLRTAVASSAGNVKARHACARPVRRQRTLEERRDGRSYHLDGRARLRRPPRAATAAAATLPCSCLAA